MDTTNAIHPASDRSAAAIVWRRCEFCDCKTNASERICCQRGREADRKTWNRDALDS